ncbi:alpha-hydroxy-acid oxidizing protein [Actinomadura sp. KC06]|uniref:alpha-hydroxy acid oxidase n=1 Tax=Actinomadura sp. KC06 TaxID=2530369 RepID=UPI001048934C|nr:alpha-hydroxy acid oxidase [Actinomadura sp. KC06]TDD28085.1 alpha-hydroxy-acid oxidizing protein [Actinomadura sp. KC06]
MHAFGFDLRHRRPPPLLNVHDYECAARRRLPAMVREYIDGGADDLATLTKNREAFTRWEFRPRILTGTQKPDLATTVAGIDLDLPVLLAPVGLSGLAHWRGDVAAARAAERRGTRHILSTASSWTIEEVAAATAKGHFFQLYPHSGETAATLMKRAWNAGNRMMMVTADYPMRGNREGERRTGMGPPPVLTPGTALRLCRHPAWTYRALRHGRIPARNLVEGSGVSAAVQSVEIQDRHLSQSTLTWDDLGWLRDTWPGRFYVKGVLTPEDADKAAALGLDGIVVSNHGGRQLDFSPATLDVLPEIVTAVGNRNTEILLDGGIRRGTDVVKALALGARAVLIGRPYLYGLAVASEKGVTRVLDILREEIERTLTLLGAPSIHNLTPTHLRPSPQTGEDDR